MAVTCRRESSQFGPFICDVTRPMFTRAATIRSAFRPLASHTRPFHLSPILRQQYQQRKCPNCGQPLPSALPACTSCWNLFSFPKDISHHDLLGVPEGSNPFVIDLPTLKQRFRQAQSVCHPDSWASKNPVGIGLQCASCCAWLDLGCRARSKSHNRFLLASIRHTRLFSTHCRVSNISSRHMTSISPRPTKPRTWNS